MQRLLLFAAALSGIATIGAVTSPAHADLIINASLGAPSFVLISGPSGAPVEFAGSIGGSPFTIGLLEGNSNQPGTPTVSDLTLIGTDIHNTSPTLAETLTLVISDTGFTQPLAGTINSSLHAQEPADPIGGANPILLLSCVFNTGINVGCGGATATAPVASIADLATPTTVTTDGPVGTLDAPYSLVEVIQFTLQPGITADFEAMTSITPAVPEPMSAALLASGLAGLALFRRRRKPA